MTRHNFVSMSHEHISRRGVTVIALFRSRWFAFTCFRRPWIWSLQHATFLLKLRLRMEDALVRRAIVIRRDVSKQSSTYIGSIGIVTSITLFGFALATRSRHCHSPWALC